jgi:hypothetical protein
MEQQRREVLVRYGAAVFVFAVTIGIWLHEIVLHPGSRMPGTYGDGSSSIRDLWAASAQHRNPFDFTHDALNGAPQGTPRVSAAILSNAAVDTAFLWTSRRMLGSVGAWNAFVIFGLFATAMATFALLSWLGCTFVASIFGGLAFGLNPYAVERVYAGHAGFVQNWVFVVVLAALLRWSARPTVARSTAVGAAIGLAFYISAYQALLASLLVLVFLGIEVVRSGRRGARLRTAGLGVFAYGVALVSVIPVLVVFARERSSFRAAVSRSAHDFTTYAAPISAYLLPSPRNPLLHHLGAFGRWLIARHPTDLTEHTLFAGYTTGLLAVVAVVFLLRRDGRLLEPAFRRRAAVLAACLAPVAFLMSLAPSERIAGISPGPSWLLAQITSYWRVYARFGELVGLALVLLAAFALTALAAREGRIRRLVPYLALALVVAELFPGNPVAIDTSARPGWVTWLAHAPRGIVATYPMPMNGSQTDKLDALDLWYQQVYADPRFSISEMDPVEIQSRDQAIRFLAEDLESPLTPRVLATEGVRYVVVHDDVYNASGQPAPVLDPRFFTQLARPGARIFSVHAPDVNIARALRQNESTIAALERLQPPSLEVISGAYAPEPFNGDEGRWMHGDTVIQLHNAQPPMTMRLTGLAFSNGGPRVLEVEDGSGRVLASQTIPTYAVPLALGVLPDPSGTSRLTLTTAPGPAPLGGDDPRTGSVFLDGLGAEPLPVYART